MFWSEKNQQSLIRAEMLRRVLDDFFNTWGRVLWGRRLLRYIPILLRIALFLLQKPVSFKVYTLPYQNYTFSERKFHKEYKSAFKKYTRCKIKKLRGLVWHARRETIINIFHIIKYISLLQKPFHSSQYMFHSWQMHFTF